MYKQIKINTGLSRKFPMPESLIEQAIALIIIGSAIFLAASFDPLRDLWDKFNGSSAQAQLIKTQQYRGTGPKRNIGVYYFDDQSGRYWVIGKKIYANSKEVPKTVEAVWEMGNPQKARLIGQYDLVSRLALGIFGIIIFAIGVFLRHKHFKQSKV